MNLISLPEDILIKIINTDNENIFTVSNVNKELYLLLQEILKEKKRVYDRNGKSEQRTMYARRYPVTDCAYNLVKDWIYEYKESNWILTNSAIKNIEIELTPKQIRQQGRFDQRLARQARRNQRRAGQQ